MIGRQLGPYRVVDRLGAGGMGEVYRARDMRLERTVAIKVLTGALADDPGSRRRFEEEARAIAALNDPRICTIHDVGRDGTLDYLVLEYLEGETLAERLRRGPLPPEEALAIAIQAGEALARAHRAGIVHRDLKPGNVMLVSGDGASGAPGVKLLDFGLAVRTATGATRVSDLSMAATAAPSSRAGPPTGHASSGFSGTVQYMSPEQLDGHPGDHRADVFAFGCVLYEMLAGWKAFAGGNLVTAIAAIMSTEPPPVPVLQAQPLLDHVVRRCLHKDPERRWQSMADIAGELRWIAEHPQPPSRDTPAPSRVRGALLPLAIAAVMTVAAAAAIVTALRRPETVSALPALALEISTAPTDDPTMALSADGTKLAFVANQDRVPTLWVRSLDEVESRPLPGTQGASFPFWSPDGRSLGFFADDKLKRVDVAAGQPLALADAPNGRGGAWGADGVILFAPGVQTPIMRVSAGGGAVTAVTTPGPTTGPDHRWPHFLPDGRFLYSSTLGPPETRGVYMASLDSSAPVHLIESDAAGRFAPPDRLLTVAQGALQVHRFDPDSGAVSGEPALIAQDVVGGAGAVAVSDTGVLAYRTGTSQRRQLVWVDRRGSVVRTIGDPETGNLASPELNPDESAVVVFSGRSGDNDVWVIELARNLARRITDGPPADAHPFWDPDGRHVVYNGARSRGPSRHAIDGGMAEPLFPGTEGGMALAWSRDRQWVLMRRGTEATGSDLFARAARDGRTEVVVTQSQADEPEGQFSPDGRWVAFVSNESGRPEVFIQSFPERRAKTQLSTDGGTQVRWAADGREVFYLAPNGTLMAVVVSFTGESPAVSLPVPLFQTHLATGTNVIGNKAQYAVSRSGRFLLNTAVESRSAPIVVLVNWMNRPGG